MKTKFKWIGAVLVVAWMGWQSFAIREQGFEISRLSSSLDDQEARSGNFASTDDLEIMTDQISVLEREASRLHDIPNGDIYSLKRSVEVLNGSVSEIDREIYNLKQKPLPIASASSTKGMDLDAYSENLERENEVRKVRMDVDDLRRESEDAQRDARWKRLLNK